jgi:unsaturated chondroitin disaccharide hydrolase
MMRRNLPLIMIFTILTSAAKAQVPDCNKALLEAEPHVLQLLDETLLARNGKLIFPRTESNDSLKMVASNDWTSGFWPGILWKMYEASGKEIFKDKAADFTKLMEKEEWNADSHDVGFKIYNSFGNGYNITGKDEYKNMIVQAAKTLSVRFNNKVGCIRSWNNPTWSYPVIIDNMMNLELLFEATKITNDSTFYHIAVSHANTTLKNQYRADYSCYHVVDYDTATGRVIKKTTAQGYSDESAWARGQAWGLYGFTMCYRETKNVTYLDQANAIANFILNNPNLPVDMIPYWDYNVPDTSTAPRDVSAAAITASALYELSGYSKNGRIYRHAADKIINNIIKFYRAPLNSHHGFILLHNTGHKPANSEVDVPIIYADYYFIEALLRRKTGKS